MTIHKKGVLRIWVEHLRRMYSCVVCPAALRNEVIWLAQKMSHSGIGKTIDRLRLDWFWHRMTRDVKKVFRLCERCQVAKREAFNQLAGRDISSLDAPGKWWESTFWARPLNPNAATNGYWY